MLQAQVAAQQKDIERLQRDHKKQTHAHTELENDLEYEQSQSVKHLRIRDELLARIDREVARSLNLGQLLELLQDFDPKAFKTLMVLLDNIQGVYSSSLSVEDLLEKLVFDQAWKRLKSQIFDAFLSQWYDSDGRNLGYPRPKAKNTQVQPLVRLPPSRKVAMPVLPLPPPVNHQLQRAKATGVSRLDISTVSVKLLTREYQMAVLPFTKQEKRKMGLSTQRKKPIDLSAARPAKLKIKANGKSTPSSSGHTSGVSTPRVDSKQAQHGSQDNLSTASDTWATSVARGDMHGEGVIGTTGNSGQSRSAPPSAAKPLPRSQSAADLGSPKGKLGLHKSMSVSKLKRSPKGKYTGSPKSGGRASPPVTTPKKAKPRHPYAPLTNPFEKRGTFLAASNSGPNTRELRRLIATGQDLPVETHEFH